METHAIIITGLYMSIIYLIIYLGYGLIFGDYHVIFRCFFFGSQARTNGIYDSDGTYQQ